MSRRGIIAAGCLAAIVLGCLFQLTIRDRYAFPLAAIFYALPRPLLCFLAIVGLVAARRRNFRYLWAGLSIALAAWVAVSDVSWNSPRPNSGASQTVVFWNVGHDLADDVAVVDEFLKRKPAILGLVETGPLDAEWLAEWESRHPDYEFSIPSTGNLLAVRGRILDGGHHRLANHGHVGWVDAEIQGTRIRAVVVDVAANPWISRKEPLRELSELLSRWNERPLVVMGDFNTPDDSVWFDAMKRDFREVFRTAGHGYAPTWPWPAPVLKLDQIWVNSRIEVDNAWQATTWSSDHRPQWGEVSWSDGPAR